MVIDPGSWSDAAAALADVEAILITHEHADHLDRETVLPLLAATPDMALYAPAGLAATLRSAEPRAAERIIDVVPGTELRVAGLSVRTYGGQHAVIHGLLPVVDNIGYLIDGKLFHPGDSFVVPDGVAPTTLLIPLHAPWADVGSTIDYLIAMRAALVLPIHDALLNERGLALVSGLLERFGQRYGSRFETWSTGDNREI
ncbi:MBL fold metallo-hydrolase [Paeniglutamicibacter cryotolerans]